MVSWTKTPLKPTSKPKYIVPTCHSKHGMPKYYLEGEVQEKFCELYPKHCTRKIMAWFGLSFSTVYRFAKELHLQKDMVAIRKEHGRQIKKTCEANGYYDSIRGKKPSEACMQAMRKKRAEGYHPLLQLKKDNPRRYKMLMKKRSEARKKLIQQERRRQELVLKRHTKLYLPFNPLSHTACTHKHAMIKECNYFAVPEHSDWVCYDSQTKRSERREATAKRHGLRVVQGDEETETDV